LARDRLKNSLMKEKCYNKGPHLSSTIYRYMETDTHLPYIPPN
jgi:hypothetical protein